MRIAMISEHASPLAVVGGVDAGGQNVHVAALSRQLAVSGHDVTVYTRRDHPALPEETTTPDGYRVVHVPAGPPEPLPKDDLLPFMRDFGAWLADRWREEPAPQVVHAHYWMSGIAGRLAAREQSIPVLLTFHALGSVKRRHQQDQDTSPPERVRLERSLASGVDHVLATCNDEVLELLRMGMHRKQATIVPCGVDTAHFRPEGERAPRGEGFRVLSVGRLVPRKGVDLVIRALADVPGAEFIVAGGPPRAQLKADPEAGRLRSVARAAGVADRVHFLGRIDRDRLPAMYRAADVVVCAPWYEPFGLTPLEAMACGTPVLAAAVGGLLDSVDDGVTGLLVAPRSPSALAEGLRQLQSDPAGRAAMARAGVRRARSRYAWGRVAQQTADVYRRFAGPASLRIAR